MSLGGYKYKGFSVEKDSNWTYTQWALAIHKLRVHAFLDSCTLSGADWSISRTNGSLDLDSTYTGCIYTLASDETNGTVDSIGYATYFKYQEYGDSTPRGYYLMLTMPRWQCVESSSEVGLNDAVDVYAGNMPTTGTARNYINAYFLNATCFYAISLDDFGSHPKEIDYIPSKSTRLMPCGSVGYYSQCSLSGQCCVIDNNGNFIGQSIVSFGYATKQGCSDIIEFEKLGNDTHLYWNVNVSSLDMINQTLNSNDMYNLATVKSKSEYSNIAAYLNMGEIDYSVYLGMRPSMTSFLRNDGTLPWGYLYQYAGNDTPTYVGINYLPSSTLNSNRVYSSFLVGSSNPGTMEVDAKGFIKTELLAFSFQDANDVSTTSGGKYLCIGRTSNSVNPTLYSSSRYLYAYVGWDNDNPGMDTTLACPLYTPAIV